tara:strand:- start:599 stop:1423 length:825 start_codon:yes stop_codon:yes gene_type:complete
MNKIYNFFLVSDSTGETLDRIYLALKAQFPDNDYKIHHFAFMRTTTQTATLIEACKKVDNPIILYTLVEKQTTNHIINECKTFNIPCFGLLDFLIPQFEKIFNQKATLKPSGQHELNKEYYKKIEAMQFTLQHDDGQRLDTAIDADIIILGVSRTSKTPTSIYLGERGFKVSNIPLVQHQAIPNNILKSDVIKVGLVIDPNRLSDVRKTRINILNDKQSSTYVNMEVIQAEINESKKIFNVNKIPVIDVTRKSVEETAASIIKIVEIQKQKQDD